MGEYFVVFFNCELRPPQWRPFYFMQSPSMALHIGMLIACLIYNML